MKIKLNKNNLISDIIIAFIIQAVIFTFISLLEHDIRWGIIFMNLPAIYLSSLLPSITISPSLVLIIAFIISNLMLTGIIYIVRKITKR